MAYLRRQRLRNKTNMTGTHGVEDDLENDLLQLKPKLDLIDQLEKSAQQTGDKQLKMQIAKERADLNEVVNKVSSKFGVSFFDAYSKLSAEKFKNDIIKAREDTEARLKSGKGEEDLVDLVDENGILLERIKNMESLPEEYKHHVQQFQRYQKGFRAPRDPEAYEIYEDDHPELKSKFAQRAKAIIGKIGKGKPPELNEYQQQRFNQKKKEFEEYQQLQKHHAGAIQKRLGIEGEFMPKHVIPIKRAAQPGEMNYKQINEHKAEVQRQLEAAEKEAQERSRMKRAVKHHLNLSGQRRQPYLMSTMQLPSREELNELEPQPLKTEIHQIQKQGNFKERAAQLNELKQLQKEQQQVIHRIEHPPQSEFQVQRRYGHPGKARLNAPVTGSVQFQERRPNREVEQIRRDERSLLDRPTNTLQNDQLDQIQLNEQRAVDRINAQAHSIIDQSNTNQQFTGHQQVNIPESSNIRQGQVMPIYVKDMPRLEEEYQEIQKKRKQTQQVHQKHSSEESKEGEVTEFIQEQRNPKNIPRSEPYISNTRQRKEEEEKFEQPEVIPPEILESVNLIQQQHNKLINVSQTQMQLKKAERQRQMEIAESHMERGEELKTGIHYLIDALSSKGDEIVKLKMSERRLLKDNGVYASLPPQQMKASNVVKAYSRKNVAGAKQRQVSEGQLFQLKRHRKATQ